MQHPAVVAAVDVHGANVFPYWEGVGINDAVAILHGHWQRLLALAHGKALFISETGWPSAGSAVGGALPSPDNAARYFLEAQTWARQQGVEVFWFASRDEPWKSKYEGEVGAHWGIFDSAGVIKAGMAAVFAGQSSADTWSAQAVPGGPGTPELQLTFVPARGSFDNLRGVLWHLPPSQFVIATLIRVSGQWWTKPTAAQPTSALSRDGSFVVDITTGGIDELADKIAVFALPAGFQVPAALGTAELPPQITANAVAQIEVQRVA